MSKPIPKGIVVDGSVAKEMKDRRFLSSLDMLGMEDVELEIDRVEKVDVKYENGRKEDGALLLYFKGSPKPLKLNVTNTKAIAHITGTIVGKEWRGKKVKVGVRKTQMAGKTVDCIRVVG